MAITAPHSCRNIRSAPPPQPIINHKYDDQWSGKTRLNTCDPHAKHLLTSSNPPQEVDDNKEIIFTYDVEFQESDVKWASRWDSYLLMTLDRTPIIVNSLINVLVISLMLASAMFGTFYQLEIHEEPSMRIVLRKVFRLPVNSELFCVYVGTGVQLFGMIAITVIFRVLGFLSPSNRGWLMTVLLLWALMGIFDGCAMGRLYKTFQGSEWIKTTLKTACMFPGIVFCVLLVLNGLIWGDESWESVPFGTMFAWMFLWFGISVPLVFIGSHIGFRKPGIKYTGKANRIPGLEQSLYMNPFVFSIVGILPFIVVFDELFFIVYFNWCT
ncbi:hypothetical protein L1987_54287 [Smallanthus sonchifolius]|uniref:Uncharacterized protein n=1 Tax=Smallanthus sonchifolius TaxID=185202 RepID=A0ACB9E7D4_9ASTR|nr:hypothetical protein L1987_54287 [Smallanthus sonchifolius]